MTCRAGGSRLNWIPLIELSQRVWMRAAALNTSRIVESESLTWIVEADCHAWNGQTLQVCVSGSHCWDHEPALVCLSEKTANDCSLFLSPLFSLSVYIYFLVFSWDSNSLLVSVGLLLSGPRGSHRACLFSNSPLRVIAGVSSFHTLFKY